MAHRDAITDEEGFIDLVACMHEAALQVESWPAILARLSTLLRNSEIGTGIVAAGRLDFHVSTIADHAYDRRMQEQYSTPQTNPGLKYMATAMPGIVVDRESIQNDGDMLRSDFYNDMMRGHDLWHAATGAIHRDASCLYPFGAMRSRRAGPFEADELRFLHRLMPHLQRSLHLLRRIRQMDVQASLAGAILDRATCGIAVTDARAQVGTANRKACDIVEEADGLRLCSGVLRAASRSEDALLLASIAEAAGMNAARHRPGRAMRITRPSGRPPLYVAITSLRSIPPGPRQSYNVTVMFNDPTQAMVPDQGLLAQTYGLTRREAEVAVLLLRGVAPIEVAESLAMRLATVRTHIQHLYLKTGTSRLPALVGLLLNTPGAVW